MAMNKKEQSAFDAAITRAETLAALRWTEPVAPDIGPSTEGGGKIAGWTFNLYRLIGAVGSVDPVEKSWSNSVAHGSGDIPTNERRYYSSSQGGIRMHSTRLRCLMAVRHELELWAAKRLQKIDRLIQAERREEEDDEN